MIGNVEIDESRFNIISQSINKDLEVVGLLNDIMDDIIEYYNNKLKFGDDTHDYVSMSFHDNLENLNILKLKTTDYYTKSKYNTDVEDSNEYDLDNYVLTGEIEGELTNVKDNFNKYTRDISANYCSNKLNHKKYESLLTENDIVILNSILKEITYEDIPKYTFPTQPDIVTIGGGDYLKNHTYSISKSLDIQEKLRKHIEDINDSISDYFKKLNELMYYSIFIINEPELKPYNSILFTAIYSNIGIKLTLSCSTIPLKLIFCCFAIVILYVLLLAQFLRTDLG